MARKSWLTAGLLLACLLAAPALAQPASQACQAAVTVATASGTDTQVVAALSGTNIFICGIEASSNGTNNFYLESATKTSCGGTVTQVGTEYYTLAGWVKSVAAYIPGLSTGQGNALCVHTTASPALSLTVWYAQH